MADYQKLKEIIDEIDILISKGVTSSDPDFKAWETKSERFLARKYGQNSLEYNKFKKTYFSLILSTLNTQKSDYVRACKHGLETTKAVFLTYLEELEEPNTAPNSQNALPRDSAFTKVFIVHGHDGELKQSVARIIEKQGIEAIILSEQANQGRTIIEKFEDFCDVDAAICLYTCDDIARAKTANTDAMRARQNVVLETGYFMGKLGRNRVIILADSGIEMPSDLSGVVYSNTTNWQIDLLKELKAIGYEVDFNMLF